MNNEKCNLDELFSLFEDSIDPSDILLSKLMAQISTAITRERLKLKMNQEQFAKHINTSQSLISRWEHGDYNFSIKKIAEIAASLDLDVNISMNNISSQCIQDSIEYKEPIAFVKTIRLSKEKQVYSSKSFSSSLSDLNTISRDQEDCNYASVC